MKRAQSYTAYEAMRNNCIITGEHSIKVKGFKYNWDKQQKAFILIVPEPVVLVSKEKVKKVKQRLEQDDKRILSQPRYVRTWFKLGSLINPMTKGLVSNPDVKEYFKNRFGE